eukprot:832431_1
MVPFLDRHSVIISCIMRKHSWHYDTDSRSNYCFGMDSESLTPKKHPSSDSKGCPKTKSYSFTVNDKSKTSLNTLLDLQELDDVNTVVMNWNSKELPFTPLSENTLWNALLCEEEMNRLQSFKR